MGDGVLVVGAEGAELGVQPGVALGSRGLGDVVAFGGGAEEHLAAVLRVGGADRVPGGGESVHALAHGRRRDLAVLAELGQGLRAVLVQPDEDVQGGVAEAAFGTFAAEAAIEPSHRGSDLASERDSVRRNRQDGDVAGNPQMSPAPANQVGALFSYVVATDSGFAPNPFFGVCTLACCKPAIRRAIGGRLLRQSGRADIAELRKADPCYIRAQNIWVVGLAGSELRDRPRRSVVYVMQVTDVLDFESYYREFPQKRPVRRLPATSADPAWHGDAIYTGNDPATARQLAPSAHSKGDDEDEGNKWHDLGGRYVLVSDHFVYFGPDAPYLPIEGKLHRGRGHRSNHSPEAIAELEELLNREWAELLGHAEVRVPQVRSTRDVVGGAGPRAEVVGLGDLGPMVVVVTAVDSVTGRASPGWTPKILPAGGPASGFVQDVHVDHRQGLGCALPKTAQVGQPLPLAARR